MTIQPKTLLPFAGQPLHASPLDTAALVVVDAQLEYVAGRLPLAGVDAAIREIGALLDIARGRGVPVIHVAHVGRPGAPLFAADGPYVRFIPSVTPKEGEAVVEKRLPNGFAGTDLLGCVQATGRRELILAGFATHMCISATARAALDLGFRTTIVAGATATRDLPDPLGGVVPADALQRAELAALADRFAIVVPEARALLPA